MKRSYPVDAPQPLIDFQPRADLMAGRVNAQDRILDNLEQNDFNLNLERIYFEEPIVVGELIDFDVAVEEAENNFDNPPPTKKPRLN